MSESDRFTEEQHTHCLTSLPVSDWQGFLFVVNLDKAPRRSHRRSPRFDPCHGTEFTRLVNFDIAAH